MKKSIVITGITGFIGKYLSQEFLHHGWEVVGITRKTHPPKQTPFDQVKFLHWNNLNTDEGQAVICKSYAIVNLAGENIFRFWTKSGKDEILQSRLRTTRNLVKVLQACQEKPAVFVQASAVGIYDSQGDQFIGESGALGSGFLARVCKKWESASMPIDQMDMRLIIMRIGVVLGKDGGFVKRLRIPYLLFLGGYAGSGKQWFSWIHIQDLVIAILFLIENKNAKGIFNLVSPNPIPIHQFSQEFGKALNRPNWIRIPESLIKIAGGTMARELILSGQRVIPKHLEELGYRFQFPDLPAALSNLFS